MRRYSLEKYSGSGSRHACPKCGRARSFTRYIDTESGKHLDNNVGRCDRETSCGYHFSPREYFAAHQKKNLVDPWRRQATTTRGRSSQHTGGSPQRPDNQTAKKDQNFIDRVHLINSISAYERNNFVQFLLELFRFDTDAVQKAISEYLIGTGPKGEAIFWQIDSQHNVRTGKLIAYDQITGKRRKERKPSWVHSDLKKTDQLPSEFRLTQCFFGEHLLTKYPELPIAIVEAEKTAVIASICKRAFSDIVWLACGGLSNLSLRSLTELGKKRRIILYPDAGCYGKWDSIAKSARSAGLGVQVSQLIEANAAVAEMESGYDLADYLIREQQKRNDPSVRLAYAEAVEERLAISLEGGDLTLTEAERRLESSNYLLDLERDLLATFWG